MQKYGRCSTSRLYLQPCKFSVRGHCQVYDFRLIHNVYHFQKGDEVLFFLRGLVPDIANQGTVPEAFRLDPEILGRFFTVAFGVGYDGVGKFQNILFTPQIGEWVIVHGLLKVDRVQPTLTL